MHSIARSIAQAIGHAIDFKHRDSVDHAATASGSALLLEDGSHLLLEDGTSHLLLENG